MVARCVRLVPLLALAAVWAAVPASADPGGPGAGLLGHPPGRPSRPPPTLCPVRHTITVPVPAGEPVFPCDFPDPMVIRAGGAYYAYATTTAWQHTQQRFPILRSTDLQHWTWVGQALPHSPRWAAGEVWAPDVVKARGRYYLFYSGKARRDGSHCVAAATSAGPRGPFRDRGTIACRDTTGNGYIDASPLVTSSTKAYLFLSVDFPRHSLSVLPLSKDLLRPAGPRKVALRVSRPWQRGLATNAIEGPFPLRHAGRYYLFYSAGCWCFDYRMGYAVASSPAGPYRDTSVAPMLVGGGPLVAPGGGSVFTDAVGGTELAFHAWTGMSAYADGGIRTLRIAPITWNGPVPVLGLGGPPG